MVIAKITVPALEINSAAFCHMRQMTSRGLGIWYRGNSKTNGWGFTFKIKRVSTNAVGTAKIKPTQCIPIITTDSQPGP